MHASHTGEDWDCAERAGRERGMTSSAGTFSPSVRFSFARRLRRVSVAVGVAGVRGVVGVTGRLAGRGAARRAGQRVAPVSGGGGARGGRGAAGGGG